MNDLYNAVNTGRGDYAVTFPGGVLETGLSETAALSLARGMNADVESVSLEELHAVAGAFPLAVAQ